MKIKKSPDTKLRLLKRNLKWKINFIKSSISILGKEETKRANLTIKNFREVITDIDCMADEKI